MTIGGWISMTITLTFVLGLFFWCCYKMVVAPETVDELIKDAETNEQNQTSQNVQTTDAR